jgi:hypothetical protein
MKRNGHHELPDRGRVAQKSGGKEEKKRGKMSSSAPNRRHPDGSGFGRKMRLGLQSEPTLESRHEYFAASLPR